MKVLGLKLTHDGSISILDDNNLIACYEIEKFENNNRYKILNNSNDIKKLLDQADYAIEDFDKIIIDGWVGEKSGTITFFDENENTISVAPYSESKHFRTIDKELKFTGFKYFNKNFTYSSYTHVTGHIMSAYMTSDFAKKNIDSYVLIWDGGMPPRLYYIHSKEKKIECLGKLFQMGVNIYSIFAQHFGPFKINPNVIKDELSIAGKVMAYVAYGNLNEEILSFLYQTYKKVSHYKDIPNLPYHFSAEFIRSIKSKSFSQEDIISTFHYFIGELLVNNLKEKIIKSCYKSKNLCFAGGAALNIKWNSLLRHKMPLNIWIPPFANDSGSSIGMVCSELFKGGKYNYLKWDVYSGPPIIKANNDNLPDNWYVKKCNIKQLAQIIHSEKEPILFLTSKAEIGPRSLGNRSIIASAENEKIKDLINNIKYRENYRPVAPIILEEKAEQVFNPGCMDPYMLFEHKVRNEWKEKIPAAIHADGSARIQTVNKMNNANLYNLLSEYESISNIPLLLNTSANYKGSGFFPDIESAMKWDKILFIWNDNYLYYKNKI